MIDEFDVRVLRNAAYYSRFSDDDSTKCGSILVTPSPALVSRDTDDLDYDSWFLGVNNPIYYAREQDWTNREYKRGLFEHAERDAIFDAALHGGQHATRNSHLYCTWAACPECARAIIQFGISRVITFQATYDLTPERWKTQIDLGIEMMKASGIQIDYYQDKLPNPVTILFDGKELTL